jgi:hypothetical protein
MNSLDLLTPMQRNQEEGMVSTRRLYLQRGATLPRPLKQQVQRMMVHWTDLTLRDSTRKMEIAIQRNERTLTSGNLLEDGNREAEHPVRVVLA